MPGPDPAAIAKAKQAGYSDTEILDHLAQTTPAIAVARKAGYNDNEIVDHLAEVPPEKPHTPLQSLGVGTRQVLDGFGNAIDVGAGAVNGAINLAAMPFRGKVENVVSTSPFTDLTSAFSDRVGLPREQSTQERTIGSIVRGGTSALVPIGGAQVAASKGVPAAVRLAQRPLTQIASGVTASLAAEKARQAGYGPLVQIASAFAGGGAPALALGVTNLAGAIASNFSKRGAVDAASRTIRSMATQTPEMIVSNIKNAPAPVKGSAYTLAEIARDPGIAGMQRGHANTNLNTAAALAERSQQNAIARTDAADLALGGGSPLSLQELARGKLATGEKLTAAQKAQQQVKIDTRLADTRAKASAAATKAKAEAEHARAGIGPGVDRTETSNTARKAFDDAYSSAKVATHEAYNAPALLRAEPVAVPQPVYTKILSSMDSFYGHSGGEMAAPLKAIVTDLAHDGLTTKDLTNIDRRLADFAGSARVQGRKSEAAFAETVRSEVGHVADSSTSPEYRAALSNAKAVRANQGRVFETGDAAAAFARDRYGNPKVGDVELPGRLVRPGAPGGDTVNGLIAAVGPKHAETITVQELRRVADEGNITTSAQANALATRYKEAAARFPAVKAQLDLLGRKAAASESATAAERAAEKAGASPEELAALKQNHALHQAVLDSPLAEIADASVDPTSYVTRLMSRQDGGIKLAALTKSVKGNADAENGLRRALGDYIRKTGAGPGVTAAGASVPSVVNTRKAIKTVLERGGTLLTPEQRAALKAVDRELAGANYAATMSKPAGSETALNNSFTQSIARPALAVASPKTGMVLGKLLNMFGNGEKVHALLTEAILDPKFAATLLSRETPDRMAKMQSQILASATGTLPQAKVK